MGSSSKGARRITHNSAAGEGGGGVGGKRQANSPGFATFKDRLGERFGLGP